MTIPKARMNARLDGHFEFERQDDIAGVLASLAPDAGHDVVGWPAVPSRGTSIVILLYPGFTLLDAVGPYEILSRLSDVDVRFVAVEPGPVVTDSGMAHLIAQALPDGGTHDVVLVPGGVGGSLRAARDPRVLAWLADVAPRARWLASVCTGSLILGAAGLLRGRQATSHWLTRDRLAELGAIPSARRVELDGSVMTAAGVSAGIDLGLVLAARLRGDDEARAIQLVVEYDPAPPFACGNVADAPPHIVARATELLMHAFRHDPTAEPGTNGATP